MEQAKTLSDTRSCRSTICISVTVRPGSGISVSRQALELNSVLNKISLLSSNCWLIATSLFLWSDQDSSLLPGIEMFTVMTCLAFLIQPWSCPDPTTKIQFFFFFLDTEDCLSSCLTSRWFTGSWCVGSSLVIVMVRNLDNFSNSLEQISCENKPLWENWKFIISYQWPDRLTTVRSVTEPNMTRNLTNNFQSFPPTLPKIILIVELVSLVCRMNYDPG